MNAQEHTPQKFPPSIAESYRPGQITKTDGRIMKVLFLDIDGVVNNYATRERFKGMLGISPHLVEKVQRIIDETGCEVVLSSTWRLDDDFREHVRKVVCEFIDVTPEKPPRLYQRGLEIKTWLKDHPEVTRFAILDDNDDFLSRQPLFKTSMQLGITDDIASKVIAYLNEGKRSSTDKH